MTCSIETYAARFKSGSTWAQSGMYPKQPANSWEKMSRFIAFGFPIKTPEQPGFCTCMAYWMSSCRIVWDEFGDVRTVVMFYSCSTGDQDWQCSLLTFMCTRSMYYTNLYLDLREPVTLRNKFFIIKNCWLTRLNDFCKYVPFSSHTQ